jgi:hypothetical protein
MPDVPTESSAVVTGLIYIPLLRDKCPQWKDTLTFHEKKDVENQVRLRMVKKLKMRMERA